MVLHVANRAEITWSVLVPGRSKWTENRKKMWGIHAIATQELDFQDILLLCLQFPLLYTEEERREDLFGANKPLVLHCDIQHSKTW